MPREDYGPPLLQYGQMVWRRRVLVVGLVCAMTVPAALVSSSQTPVYEASAELVLGQQRLDSDFNIEATDVSDRQISTQMRVITGNQVTERAVAQGATSAVQVYAPSLSNVLGVTARDSRPQQAAVTANAYAQAYIDYRTEQVRATLDDAAEQLQQRIALLQDEIDPLTGQVQQAAPEDRAAVQARIQPLQSGLQEQQASLQAQLGQLQVQRTLAASGASLVQRAEAPATPVSPRPVQDTALAAVLGLALGISVAILLETMGAGAASASHRAAPTRTMNALWRSWTRGRRPTRVREAVGDRPGDPLPEPDRRAHPAGIGHVPSDR